MICDGLILDIDGTIWNTTEVVAQAWNNAIDKYYPHVPHVTSQILQGQFGKTMKVISDNLFGCISEADRKILIDYCAQAEQKGLLGNTKNLTYDGVVDTINYFYGKVPLFIVSNCQDGYIELVMEKNKIANCIKDFECYGHNLKEKWENIKLICLRNGLENPVYVGDTQGDCDSCKKAAVPFVFASYGFGTANSFDAKIDSFPELKKIIDLYNK